MKHLKYLNFIEDLNYYRFGIRLKFYNGFNKIDPEDELLLQLVKAGEIEELYKVFNFRRRLQKRFTFWGVREDRLIVKNQYSFINSEYKRFKIEYPLK